MKTSWGKPVHIIPFIRTLLIVLAVAVCTVAAEDLEALRKKAEAGDAEAQADLGNRETPEWGSQALQLPGVEMGRKPATFMNMIADCYKRLSTVVS